MSTSKREICVKGIILKKQKYSETSLILDVFSEENGLITVIAKGVRKKNSKTIGLLETLNELEFTLYKNPGSEWHIFKDGEIITFYLKDVTFEINVLMQAAAEIYRQLILDLNDYKILYELITQYLEFIRSIPKNGIVIFWRFLLRLFKIIGIELIIKTCIECNKLEHFYAYYPQKHGFICRNCFRPLHEKNVIRLTQQSAYLLANFMHMGKMLDDLELEKTTIQQMNRIFLLHLSEHFHKRFYLKTVEML